MQGAISRDREARRGAGAPRPGRRGAGVLGVRSQLRARRLRIRQTPTDHLRIDDSKERTSSSGGGNANIITCKCRAS